MCVTWRRKVKSKSKRGEELKSMEGTRGRLSTTNYPQTRSRMKNISTLGTCASVDGNVNEEEKRAIALYEAREEEIQMKKMQVKEKVEFQLGRAEEETRRLAQVWEDIELLTDPMRKEVTIVRKKIDMANRELRSLGQSCHKKEKEYREAVEVLHQRNEEKNQLTITLVELVKQSEKARMKKLEELNKILDPSG